MNKPEILSPAGDFECLQAALDFGADAVFLAGKMFGMRSSSKNFDRDDLKKACDLAHSMGKKIHVTCNILPKNSELEALPSFLEFAQDIGVDALIIADAGVLEMAKRYAPKVAIHISTQAGVTNYATANALYNLGASRVVMAREVPLSDIAEDKIVKFDTAVRPIPQFDPANMKMISQGPSICVFNKRDPQEVLASWLFAQYLLTNEVQIAYSETEGYVPVTTKAQITPEYQDYLAKKGSDNTDHYQIKIEASELLLNHLDDTFVTPVFNGSTSLRDAAGQMIENVTKSVRRKETVNDAYMENLFSSVTSLYHLDQIHSASSANELGELPAASKTLLITLVVLWVLMGGYYCMQYRRSKKV